MAGAGHTLLSDVDVSIHAVRIVPVLLALLLQRGKSINIMAERAALDTQADMQTDM